MVVLAALHSTLGVHRTLHRPAATPAKGSDLTIPQPPPLVSHSRLLTVSSIQSVPCCTVLCCDVAVHHYCWFVLGHPESEAHGSVLHCSDVAVVVTVSHCLLHCILGSKRGHPPGQCEDWGPCKKRENLFSYSMINGNSYINIINICNQL